MSVDCEGEEDVGSFVFWEGGESVNGKVREIINFFLEVAGFD